jgi:hypothetical protein
LKENYTATIPIFDYKPTNKKQLLNAYIKNTNVGKLLNKEVLLLLFQMKFLENSHFNLLYRLQYKTAFETGNQCKWQANDNGACFVKL